MDMRKLLGETTSVGREPVLGALWALGGLYLWSCIHSRAGQGEEHEEEKDPSEVLGEQSTGPPGPPYWAPIPSPTCAERLFHLHGTEGLAGLIGGLQGAQLIGGEGDAQERCHVGACSGAAKTEGVRPGSEGRPWEVLGCPQGFSPH